MELFLAQGAYDRLKDVVLGFLVCGQLIVADETGVRLGLGVLYRTISPSRAALLVQPTIVTAARRRIGVRQVELDTFDGANALPFRSILPNYLGMISEGSAESSISFVTRLGYFLDIAHDDSPSGKKNPQPRPRVQVWEETKGHQEEADSGHKPPGG
jgi:hypothetical protein